MLNSLNSRMRNSSLLTLISLFFVFGCTSADISRILKEAGNSLPLTQQEVAGGLKEALVQGIQKGADSASRVDGFFKNDLIRIALPEDARRVENTLRQVGLGSEVDRVLLAINRGAESAAQEAKPLFINAIRQLTIQDAFNILKGEPDAATQYLRQSTESQLKELFQPRIQEALNQVGATKYYGDLANSYNSLPLTNQKIDPDLNAYVTERAIDGLFKLVREEEKKIRENPLERSTALMKKVFAAQD
jgi:hypothetical protein